MPNGIQIRAATACLVAGIGLVAQTAMAQTTVTLNGTTYTLQSHPRVWLDGPAGPLTTSLQDTTNRAQTGNPAYQGLVTDMTNLKSLNVCSAGPNTYNGIKCPGANAAYISGGDNLSQITNAAFLWFAQGANPSDPNGYLAIAKYGLDHVEDISGGSFACDESAAYCNRNAYDLFNPMLFERVWQAYSLVRSQMSPGEISTFVGKILNDNDTSHNGLNATACTKQTLTTGAGTITSSTSSNVVTGVGTSFTSTLSVGSVIFSPSGANAYVVGTVYQITSDTQVILTTKAQTNSAGSSWRYAGAWATGDCGLVWLYKHHQVAPHLISSQSSHYQTDYPLTGGSGPGDDNNIEMIELKSDILIGLALADDDARAGTLLTQGYNYYYYFMYPKLKMGWDGYTQGGANYQMGVWEWGIMEIALSVRNSVVSGPDLTPGYYLSRFVPYSYFEALPNQAAYYDVWGDGYAASADIWNNRGALEACYITSGATGTLTADCQAFYNYLRNVRSDYTSGGWGTNAYSYAPWFYTFYNYNATSSAPSANQYVFKDNDITYSQCTSTFTATSPTGEPACVQNQMWGDAISKSDWTSTATHMLIKGGWDQAGQDHTDNVQQGAFHIYRNVYLLGGDESSNDGDGDYNYCSGVTEDMIDLNCTNNTVASYAPFSRWASTDPTGDSLNRYAYAMVDLTNTYNPGGNATRVQRHIAHFKKSGAKDYIVTYDDIALSSAIAVAPKAYFHYFLNGVAPGTAISYSGSSRTISNRQASSLLNSSFLDVGGLNTAALVVDNANGTYTGGNGHTFRAYMCPSSNGTTCDSTKTAGEWIGVFQPINGTSGSMPALTQLTSTNFRTVQIADGTTPKVASFAQGGSTYSAVSFTSTHSGIGQYLIAGLTPGTYNVTVGGSAVSGSPFVVNSGDNTLYFESTNGVVIIVQVGSTGPPPGVNLSCDLNGDGVVNVQDVQLAISAALNLAPCLPQYQLDGSGACTVVDVQRVAAATLGASCKIGP